MSEGLCWAFLTTFFFTDIAESRVVLSTTLYYHLLEGTLVQEKKRLKNPNIDLSVKCLCVFDRVAENKVPYSSKKSYK